MKNLLYLSLVIFVGVFITACDRDEDHDHNNDQTTEFDYRIAINSPSIENKSIQDSIYLHVDFISDQNATIHHVNVKIYNKANGLEVYNAPSEAHVHESSGTFAWHDDFVLSATNGLMPNSDYILEAKVWGHSAGLEEVVESIEFRVEE